LELLPDMRQKTPHDYHILAEKRGFKWLGPVVSSANAKTVWECPNGHRWEARYGDIYTGYGCRACAGKLPKTVADYHFLAQQRGLRWLGPEVRNVMTKTGWACSDGHQWQAPFSSIQQGSGCPYCKGSIPKTPADYQLLATNRGFRWLGPEVRNVTTITNWECSKGHRFETAYNRIQQGLGCRICSGLTPKTPADYHLLAQQRGIIWIGPEVPNVKTPTAWQCLLGHVWKTPYSNIQQGSGCPICVNRVQKMPEDYRQIAQERGFRWLGPEVKDTPSKTFWECSLGHRWEASYSGIQQGYGCPRCSGLLPRTESDYYALAEERGFRWLGQEAVNTRTKTIWECSLGHTWEAPYSDIKQGNGCPFCANKVPKTAEDYHALASLRGFSWIGPDVADTNTKTTWQCQEGHCWSAPYHNIKQGSGCPTCVDVVNGALVSHIQRKLCESLKGELNKRFGRYNIDIALEIKGTLIAIEYDSWYWHGARQEKDAQRDLELLQANWHVLRIKSKALLPEQKELDSAINRLLAGETYIEIVLDDWGKGSPR
jgi:very-short-patch-repair endonuclease